MALGKEAPTKLATLCDPVFLPFSVALPDNAQSVTHGVTRFVGTNAAALTDVEASYTFVPVNVSGRLAIVSSPVVKLNE